MVAPRRQERACAWGNWSAVPAVGARRSGAEVAQQASWQRSPRTARALAPSRRPRVPHRISDPRGCAPTWPSSAPDRLSRPQGWSPGARVGSRDGACPPQLGTLSAASRADARATASSQMCGQTAHPRSTPRRRSRVVSLRLVRRACLAIHGCLGALTHSIGFGPRWHQFLRLLSAATLPTSVGSSQTHELSAPTLGRSPLSLRLAIGEPFGRPLVERPRNFKVWPPLSAPSGRSVNVCCHEELVRRLLERAYVGLRNYPSGSMLERTMPGSAHWQGADHIKRRLAQIWAGVGENESEFG